MITKICQKWVRKKLVYASGIFLMSGAESPENAREQVFGSRSALFEKMSKIGSGKNLFTLLGHFGMSGAE